MRLCVTAAKQEMGNEMTCLTCKTLYPQYQEPFQMWYDHYSSIMAQQLCVLNSILENQQYICPSLLHIYDMTLLPKSINMKWKIPSSHILNNYIERIFIPIKVTVSHLNI